MESSGLLIETSGGVAKVTLNRPERRNALSERLVSELKTALDTLLHGAWPGRRSLLECAACDQTQPTGSGTVRVLTQRPTDIELHAESKTDQWLIVSSNNLPGWRVTVDQQPAAPVMANGAFFGIRVPAGAHDVSLRFTYRALLEDSFGWLRAKVPGAHKSV